MPYYPTKQKQNRSHQVSQYRVNPSSPSSCTKGLPTIIPTINGSNRNIAGQVYTRIHLKNARGEEMNIYQTQNVLNLLNGATGSWVVGGKSNAHKKRRK